MRKSSNPKWKTRFSEKGKVQKKLQTGHLSEGVNKILPFSLSNRDQSVFPAFRPHFGKFRLEIHLKFYSLK